jgi:hypothetical protein
MFLFEPFGPERFYEKVQAPAVPLRIDMKLIADRMRLAYGQFSDENDLYTFFFKPHQTSDMLYSTSVRRNEEQVSREIMNFFRHPQNQSLAA